MAFSFSSMAIGFIAGVAAAAIGFVALSPQVERIESEPTKSADFHPVTVDPPARVVNDVASPTTAAQLRAEMTHLQAEVAQLKSELGTERRGHEDVKDVPVPFPVEIAERHTEKGLMTAVQAALAELAVRGEVEAIDCSENPCLAQVRASRAVDAKQLRKTAALAAYKNDGLSISSGSGPSGDNVFVIGFREPVRDVAPDDPQRHVKREELEAKRRGENMRRSSRENELLQSALAERR